MSDTETIVARATPAGAGGVAVVRVSGPSALTIGQTITGRTLKARHAHYCPMGSGQDETIDEGIALYFPAPHSYTGEAVLELQCHGSPVIVAQLVERCLELGARLARPGEFTERAFLNGRLDLSQAEAVADLIGSTTAAAARAAQRSMQGAFSREVGTLVSAITELRVYVESAIDFPDEEIDFLAEGEVGEKLAAIIALVKRLRTVAGQGMILRDGLHLVLAGRPNAGKSSLLNRLAGRDSAIVSAEPGTTRDVLREHLDVDGLPIHVFDTAGLRQGGGDIEREGMRRARESMQQADRILLLIDATTEEVPTISELASDIPLTEVINKIDLTNDTQGRSDSIGRPRFYLSAKTGEGVSALVDHLKELAGFAATSEGTFSARQRHLDAIDRALTHLRSGHEELSETASGELLAEELRLAQQSLSTITGAFTADDLLGEIFSSFCIGK